MSVFSLFFISFLYFGIEVALKAISRNGIGEVSLQALRLCRLNGSSQPCSGNGYKVTLRRLTPIVFVLFCFLFGGGGFSCSSVTQIYLAVPS
jgi:hypothetical protein